MLRIFWYGVIGYFLVFWPSFTNFISEKSIEELAHVTTLQWVMLFGNPLFGTLGMIYARLQRADPEPDDGSMKELMLAVAKRVNEIQPRETP